MSLFEVSYVVLWVLVVVLAVAVFALYHHFGQMYLSDREGRADQGPDVGSELPRIEQDDVLGRRVSLPRPSRPSVVLVASTDCQPCATLLPELARVGAARPMLDVAVLCAGSAAEVRDWASSIGAELAVVHDPRRALATRLRVGVTPFVIVSDAEGLVLDRGIVNEAKGLDRAVALAAGDGARLAA